MAFTVFDSFAEVYDDFDASDPEDLCDRAMLADAIMMYGLHGVEADLPKHLRRVFKAMKNAIDNSKDARGRGGKGGRPRKKPVSDKPETQVSESENPNLTCPSLALPSLACVDGTRGGDADGFAPPTLEECRAYFADNCISSDPDKFWAHYESQGWIRSNGMPVASLKAAALLWNGNQKRLDAEAHARGKPTDAEIQAATFKPTRTPEQTRAELERRWREEHPGIDPAKVKAPSGTTADPVALKAYQDARRLLDARAACERRAS